MDGRRWVTWALLLVISVALALIALELVLTIATVPSDVRPAR
jgi:hypothetical protein